MNEKICNTCGEIFYYDNMAHGQKYCSDHCGRRLPMTGESWMESVNMKLYWESLEPITEEFYPTINQFSFDQDSG